LIINQDVFNQAFVVVVPSVVNADSNMSDEVSCMVDDTEISSAVSSSKAGRSRQGRFASSGVDDLQKKLLKSEQAKSTSRKTRSSFAVWISAGNTCCLGRGHGCSTVNYSVVRYKVQDRSGTAICCKQFTSQVLGATLKWNRANSTLIPLLHDV
jgi:hypothetical protein